MSDSGSTAAEFAKQVLQIDKRAMLHGSKPTEKGQQEATRAASQAIGSRTAFQSALAKFQSLERGGKGMPQVHASSVGKTTQALTAVVLKGPTANNEQDSAKQDHMHSYHQQNFKVLVSDRFAALVRKGAEPNAAAARAILETAGRQVKSEEPEAPDSPRSLPVHKVGARRTKMLL